MWLLGCVLIRPAEASGGLRSTRLVTLPWLGALPSGAPSHCVTCGPPVAMNYRSSRAHLILISVPPAHRTYLARPIAGAAAPVTPLPSRARRSPGPAIYWLLRALARRHFDWSCPANPILIARRAAQSHTVILSLTLLRLIKPTQATTSFWPSDFGEFWWNKSLSRRLYVCRWRAC